MRGAPRIEPVGDITYQRQQSKDCNKLDPLVEESLLGIGAEPSRVAGRHLALLYVSKGFGARCWMSPIDPCSLDYDLSGDMGFHLSQESGKVRWP